MLRRLNTGTETPAAEPQPEPYSGPTPAERRHLKRHAGASRAVSQLSDFLRELMHADRALRDPELVDLLTEGVERAATALKVTIGERPQR